MAWKRKKAQPKVWTIEEIKKLQEAKACGMDTKDIVKMFSDRSYASVAYAIDKYCTYEKSYDRVPSRCKRYNPNPPTPLTYVLVHNYYEENIRHGMTRDATIADIADALNRSKSWVKQALKIDIRKYMEKGEEENAEFKRLNAKLSKWE